MAALVLDQTNHPHHFQEEAGPINIANSSSDWEEASPGAYLAANGQCAVNFRLLVSRQELCLKFWRQLI